MGITLKRVRDWLKAVSTVATFLLMILLVTDGLFQLEITDPPIEMALVGAGVSVLGASMLLTGEIWRLPLRTLDVKLAGGVCLVVGTIQVLTVVTT